MADKVYLYIGDAATSPETTDDTVYMIHADDSLMALYPDIVKKYSAGAIVAAAAPTAYANEAAALVAFSTAIPLGGLNPRSLQLEVEGFGNASLPILSPSGDIASTHVNDNDWGATLDHFGLFGATPFPTTPVAESHLNVTVIGFIGESRSSN